MSVPWQDELLDHPDLSAWTARRLEDPPGWYVEGPCPTCDHVVRATWLDDVVRGTSGLPAAVPNQRVQIPVRCRCTEPSSHGENRRGCGRGWTVEVVP